MSNEYVELARLCKHLFIHSLLTDKSTVVTGTDEGTVVGALPLITEYNEGLLWSAPSTEKKSSYPHGNRSSILFVAFCVRIKKMNGTMDSKRSLFSTGFDVL